MAGTVRGPLLWLRAWALAFVTVLTGAFGHATADGNLPGAIGLTLLFAAAFGLAAIALRNPVSRGQAILLVVGGQAVVHGWLTVTAGHIGEADARGFGALAHVIEHGPMMAVHLASAAVVGWWLAQGEQALWLFLGLAASTIGARLSLLLAAPLRVVSRTQPRVRRTARVRLPQPLWLTTCVVRRGPPVPICS